MLCRAAQVTHWGRWIRCSLGNNRRPLVCPISVLLHVLCQVRLLSVTLATVGTDVRLQVLGLLVLGDMLEQRYLVVEALVAGVALVRLVSLVAARVGLQVGQLGEGLRATWEKKQSDTYKEKSRLISRINQMKKGTWMATLVRLVPCVSPDVLLKVGELGELSLADLATVRLDPEMDAHVLRKVGAVGE